LLPFVTIFENAVGIFIFFFIFQSITVKNIALFFSGSFWLLFSYHKMVTEKEPVF